LYKKISCTFFLFFDDKKPFPIKTPKTSSPVFYARGEEKKRLKRKGNFFAPINIITYHKSFRFFLSGPNYKKMRIFISKITTKQKLHNFSLYFFFIVCLKHFLISTKYSAADKKKQVKDEIYIIV